MGVFGVACYGFVGRRDRVLVVVRARGGFFFLRICYSFFFTLRIVFAWRWFVFNIKYLLIFLERSRFRVFCFRYTVVFSKIFGSFVWGCVIFYRRVLFDVFWTLVWFLLLWVSGICFWILDLMCFRNVMEVEFCRVLFFFI